MDFFFVFSLVFLQFLSGMCATDSLLSGGSCNTTTSTHCYLELGLLHIHIPKMNKRKEIK